MNNMGAVIIAMVFFLCINAAVLLILLAEILRQWSVQ